MQGWLVSEMNRENPAVEALASKGAGYVVFPEVTKSDREFESAVLEAFQRRLSLEHDELTVGLAS